VSNWCQTAPILPVFPTHPVYNHLSVNNLGFRQFHGMEEVIGSIPIRSTNNFNNLAGLFQNPCPQMAKFSRATALLPSFLLLLKPSSAPSLLAAEEQVLRCRYAAWLGFTPIVFALARLRERWVMRRTAVVNQIRGLLLKRGITLRKGRRHLDAALPGILEDGTSKLSGAVRLLLAQLKLELDQLAIWLQKDGSKKPMR
jgi:hypothetical protein